MLLLCLNKGPNDFSVAMWFCKVAAANVCNYAGPEHHAMACSCADYVVAFVDMITDHKNKKVRRNPARVSGVFLRFGPSPALC